MAFDYPVFLDLAGVPVLVVGGGPVALRKLVGLVDAGAMVTIVAPDVVDGVHAIAGVAGVERRPYATGDLAGKRLVVTATDDPAVNAHVAADARAAGVFVNSADDPDNCTFILPAIARRGPLTVAVSTGGTSPALAGRLRDEIAATHLTAEAEAAAIDLGRQRAEIHAAGASTEDIDWNPRIDAALAGRVELRDTVGRAGATCRALLDLLPTWFGIPEANDAYVAMAELHPTVIASVTGEDVGITTIVRHSPFAAEIHLMAVHPAHHRRGIGRAMIDHVEAGLVADGVEFLQVKTLSATAPDPGYAKTRAFYTSYGFRPLEEFPTLWDPDNPALQLIKAVRRR